MYERPDTCTTFPLNSAALEGSTLPAFATAPAHCDPGSLTLTSKHTGGELQWEHLRMPEPIKTSRTLLSMDGEAETSVDSAGMDVSDWNVLATLD